MKRRNEFKPNKLSNDAKKSMFVRCLTAAIALCIVVPLIVIGEWAFLILMIVVAGIGAFELVRCAKRKYNPLLYIMTILLVVVFSIFPIIKNIFEVRETGTQWYLFFNFNSIFLSTFILGLGAILIFCMPIIDKNFEVRDACFIFSFGILIGLGIQSVIFLRFFPQYIAYDILNESKNNFVDFAWSQSLMWLIVGGTCFADIGAYFIGVLFGKHKMLERISPKKTWEGFAGGVFFSMAFILAFGFIMAAVGRPIVPGIFDFSHWYFLLILSIFIPVMSVVGDFVFSSIKRYYGIKDFGFILPGHGGVLDRLDSILFTASTSAVLIIIFNCSVSQDWGGIFL